MTDGYWNGSAPFSIDNEDGDGNTAFDTKPYQDTRSDTLADVAMFYYERDLVPGNLTHQRDLVPTSDTDKATHQHMVTYGVSFGVPGSLELDEDAVAQCLQDMVNGCPWTNPYSSYQARIDDLHHAAVNSRGEFLTADNPRDLLNALLEIANQIEDRTGTSAAVGITPSGKLGTDTFIYQGLYDTTNWSGDVLAYRLYSQAEGDASNTDDIIAGAVVSDSNGDPIIQWSAETTFKTRRTNQGLANWWGNRVVITSDGSAPHRRPPSGNPLPGMT
jgi:type IV pilus assembly protein PilY1